MNAPAGGECGGISVNRGNSLREENSSRKMNSCTTVIGAEPGRLVATTTAGSGELAVQQLVCAVFADSEARIQQLCSLRRIWWKQFPNGAIIVPISTTATDARL